MKKVVIVTRKLVVGGIEKALIEMVNNMPKDEYEITVVVMESDGKFENKLPYTVKLKNMYENELSIKKKKILRNIKEIKFMDAYKLLKHTRNSYNTRSMFESYDSISNTLDGVAEEYDIAISYSTPVSFPVIYVINNIKAKKKIMWIHSDISQFKDSIIDYSVYYNKYDHIFSVSKNGLDKFIKKFPNLKEKCDVFYNGIYEADIQKLASEETVFNDKFDGIRIVTVARLSPEKGIDLVIDSARELVDKGYNIKWYCIGDGDIRSELELKIKEVNLEENIYLEGNKENPLPYIKECDIYVQPSRYEGYCITLSEARALKKPIIATEFMGALEQIKNEETGIIVKIDKYEISRGIVKLIEDDTLRFRLINNLKKETIDTRDEVNKFEKIHLS